MILGSDGKPLNGSIATPTPGQVEIVRSVSFKLNLGNYQSMDFFCSQKAQCAPADADNISADLYEWCYEQVMGSVRQVKTTQAKKEAAKAQRSVA
jgi:hypothetical protein